MEKPSWKSLEEVVGLKSLTISVRTVPVTQMSCVRGKTLTIPIDANTAICRHWPVEDRDTIIRINDEIQALTDYNYVLNPEFINDAKRIKHLECNHRPNSLFKEDNIQFQYETSSSMLLKLPEIKFVN